MEKIKITPPEGFEVDKEKSTFEEIVFKPIQKVDLSILNDITAPGGHVFGYSPYAHAYLVRPEHISLLRKCTDEEIAYIKQNKPDWFRKTKWEDFGKVQGYFDINPSNTCNYGINSEDSKCLWPTKELAAASKALCQLVRYMDDWNEGWVPDWDDAGSVKTSIVFHKNKIETNPSFTISRPLYFKTNELAELFLIEFKNLLEIAKPLL